jgi:putative FmdB family regulatory protein
MPLYDYYCKNCSKTFESFANSRDESISCDDCGQVAERQFPTKFIDGLFPSNGLTLEHVPGGPKTFHSRSELVSFANDNKLELGALL